MAYLNETNPEVFFVLPRPGGIANIELPEPEIPLGPKGSKGTLKSSRSLRSTRSTRSKSKSIIDARFFTSTPGTTSREHRIHHALTTVPWILFDDDEEYADEKPLQPNPLQDTIDMLAISITTIMLLAAGHKDISKDHLRWTLSYLECVRDEFGCNPPNVTGIINHIRMIDGNLESFNETLEAEVEMGGFGTASPKESKDSPEREIAGTEAPQQTGTEAPQQTETEVTDAEE
ncbi:uncharacterized protein [Leptinotarsa decemlineata]|uniref:uncharacterized protein n=1 Tax=Leptinotarsa decemlineata TaxID=7539 RepID=UPI000C252482|nr:uncharacterized protein LOC111503397 [Leptinotarsa decemlineata]